MTWHITSSEYKLTFVGRSVIYRSNRPLCLRRARSRGGRSFIAGISLELSASEEAGEAESNQYQKRHNLKYFGLRDELRFGTAMSPRSVGIGGGVDCDLSSEESRRCFGNMDRRRLFELAMLASSMLMTKLPSSTCARFSTHSTTHPMPTTAGLGLSSSLSALIHHQE